MKHFKKKLLFALLAVVSLTCQVQAQVTIGDGAPPRAGTVLDLKRTNILTGTMGGLLLPSVDISDVELIPDNFTDAAVRNQDINLDLAGTLVYNTNVTTGEGIHYWDGNKWRKFNSASSLKSDGCENAPVNANGGTVSCQITDPDCEIAGEFTFEMIVGQEFTTLDVSDAGQGKFNLTFSPNDQAVPRSAIILVISPCGNSSMFIFTQNGDPTGCGISTVPAIKTQNPGGTTDICSGGAVYLYLDGYPTTGTYIWTLNGKTLSTGNSYVATQAGKYIVYGDKIGCANKQEITLSVNGTGAPAPVDFVVVGNNGVACGAGGTVELIVTTPVTGTVVWYKDGMKQVGKTGTRIDADKGVWEAVVDDGGCSSKPTVGVSVSEDLTGGNVPTPKMKINGLTSGWSLCRGGSIFLEVDGGLLPGITYTWYADNTEIGRGTGIYYPVPAADKVVIRLRATGAGCAKETNSIETINVTTAPNAPYITVNTSNVLCGGEATLTASVPAGTTAYRWFKDGVVIAGETAAGITVTTIGSYTVSAITGTCVSIQSGAKVISASDFATMTWVSHPATASQGETKTYSVSLDFPQGATYIWSVTGGTLTNGQGTSSITVNFPTVGTSTVTCTATNACGTPTGSPLNQPVTVNALCVVPVISIPANDVNIPIKVGGSTSMSVTASGSPNRKYQWYSGTAPSGTLIPSATNASYSYTGAELNTFNFYCVVSVDGGCTPATSKKFTITVQSDPEGIKTGVGTFSGKSCFDIAQGNDNANGCAPLSSRTAQRTDFALTTPQDPASGAVTTPYTGTQVYTFTPSGAVSNVRFDYVNVLGEAVESITPNADYTGNNINYACKLTVFYNKDLNRDLKGLTRTAAYKADLYAIYNMNANGTGGASAERKVKLTATLADCACCGAYTAGGQWLAFMCHNLGADESLDPFIPAKGLHGNYYQWGRNTVVANADTPASAISGWNTTTAPNGAWSDASTSTNDPCPAGYRVPRKTDLDGVLAQTALNPQTPIGTWTNVATNFSSGRKIGTALFLPAAGNRSTSNGQLSTRGGSGYYWSSTEYSTNSAYYLNVNSTGANVCNTYRTSGFSVRCVAE